MRGNGWWVGRDLGVRVLLSGLFDGVSISVAGGGGRRSAARGGGMSARATILYADSSDDNVLTFLDTQSNVDVVKMCFASGVDCNQRITAEEFFQRQWYPFYKERNPDFDDAWIRKHVRDEFVKIMSTGSYFSLKEEAERAPTVAESAVRRLQALIGTTTGQTQLNLRVVLDKVQDKMAAGGDLLAMATDRDRFFRAVSATGAAPSVAQPLHFSASAQPVDLLVAHQQVGVPARGPFDL